MLVEQFIYGLFDDDYDLIKSDGVSALLSEGALNYLQHVGDDSIEDEDTYNIIEGVLAVSFIRARFKRDRYKRWTVRNHTFLVQFEDYLQYVQLFNVFRPYFNKLLDKVHGPLEPLQIG